MINGWVRAALVGASLAALGAGSSLAATTAPASAAAVAAPKARPHKTAITVPGVVEPGSVQALAKMSAYLRTIPTFQVKMTTERDEVDDFGQLLTFDGATTYTVRTPDAFSIEVTDADKTRQYVYDGKTVTVFDPKTAFYATFKAAPTIRQTLDLAADRYGITVPLDDLFHWDQGNDQVSALTSGHFVGKTSINGQDADHYAYRQAGVDWQIWIATGDKPVPLRVVITASDDPARPQFEANLSWDTSAQVAADTFVFTPPANARLIPIQSDVR